MVEKRALGSSGPEISTVGFGAWAAGGPWKVGWGPQSDEDSIAAIRRSIELGCNWIDTAAIYGLGHSEEVVGRALAGIDRATVIVATKCGRVPDETGTPHSDLRPRAIREQLEESLVRLKTDYVDLYQIHWPDNETGTPIEESWSAMSALQAEGKIRYLGASNFDTDQLARCEAVRHVDSLQPPYSLVRRDIEADVLPWCREHCVGVIVYSPMQAGLLSGAFDMGRVAEDDWRRRNAFFQEPALSRHLALVERLRPIAARSGKTVGQLAIAWTVAQPGVTAAIVGARRPEQVDQNAGAMGWALTLAELNEIEDAARAAAPTTGN